MRATSLDFPNSTLSMPLSCSHLEKHWEQMSYESWEEKKVMSQILKLNAKRNDKYWKYEVPNK